MTDGLDKTRMAITKEKRLSPICEEGTQKTLMSNFVTMWSNHVIMNI